MENHFKRLIACSALLAFAITTLCGIMNGNGLVNCLLKGVIALLTMNLVGLIIYKLMENFQEILGDKG